MDISSDAAIISADISPLSYDDAVAYEDQVPTHVSNDPARASLAKRIGNTKVYLLSEASVARAGKLHLVNWNGKRKRGEDLGEDMEEDVEVEEEDLSMRGNAVLLQGPPISHLPTTNLFAYATHFDAHPMGLEWVDDNTCVFVFESKAAARFAQRYLQKSAAEEPDEDGFVTAKPIPIAIWPPEERINKSLGKGEGLKGTIRMRWARQEDVKKKGAKKESAFYKKHGANAGKEAYVPPSERGEKERVEGVQKRRRREQVVVDNSELKAELDNEIDNFLAEDSQVAPPTPVSTSSKMRSDYISGDGRTLLERTSPIRIQPAADSLASRITAPLPRRRGQQNSTRVREWDERREGSSTRARRNDRDRSRAGRTERPKKTQQELDDELEAFLNE